MTATKSIKAYERKCRKYQDECIQMFLDAFDLAFVAATFDRELQEEEITARLFGYLDNLKTKDQWVVNPEVPIFDFSITSGVISPKRAKRPDLKFEKYLSWHGTKPFEYRIEAKNLSESDWVKSDNKKISSSRQQARYMTTGIDNFKYERYPYGCLAAYVVQGNIQGITQSLNARIQKANRTSEQLYHYNGQGPSQQFQSTHITTSQKQIDLIHIFLQIP